MGSELWNVILMKAIASKLYCGGAASPWKYTVRLSSEWAMLIIKYNYHLCLVLRAQMKTNKMWLFVCYCYFYILVESVES